MARERDPQPKRTLVSRTQGDNALSNLVIGFIGLGRMGTPMATRLLDAGYTLVVADSAPAARDALVHRGARPASTPRDVADQADLVLVSLPTPQVVNAVALGKDGAVHGQRMRLWIDLSTTGQRAAADIARGIAAGGRAEVLDCPVSGGVAGAAKGSLTMMAAGSTAAVEMATPVLEHLGKLRVCGDVPGHGQWVKIINNTLSVIAMAASAEAAVLAEKAGLDVARMFDVINVSSGASNASQTKVPRHMLPRSYDFGFATALSQKDVGLCLEQAEALGMPMLVGAMARQVLTLTAAAFGPEADFTLMHKMFEQLAGLPAPSSHQEQTREHT
jgi:3-hydroxyisobutyrate dehydrogenase-like beta-hydroxyacid dehydrogenase